MHNKLDNILKLKGKGYIDMKNKIISIIKKIDWANISAGTYTRYILMIIAIINLILNAFKCNPIKVSESEVYQVVSNILTCVLFIVNTWKNNSVTGSAIEADSYLYDLKKGVVNMDTEKESENDAG